MRSINPDADHFTILAPPATITRSPEAEEFGRRVRSYRQRLGVSQMALADAAGMHFTYVSSVERGQRNITLVSILRIAAALGIDAGELIAGMTPPTDVVPLG